MRNMQIIIEENQRPEGICLNRRGTVVQLNVGAVFGEGT
jgi:hypothetical protein